MPSGGGASSTFHMPNSSSFYGKHNDEDSQYQMQTQINISHMRCNTTDGEIP